MSPKFGLLVVASQLALFSCAPKDDKLVKPAVVGVQSVPASEDAVKMLFISLDRQVEALHYLKVALNSDFASSRKITLEDVAPGAKKLSANPDKLDTGDYLQTAPSNLLATVVMSDDKTTVKTVRIQDNGNGLTEQALFPKANNPKNESVLSAKNIQKQITVDKLTTKDKDGNEVVVDGKYAIEISAYDETNAKVGGNGFSNTFSKFTIFWDGKVESLNQDIKITSALLGQNKYGVTKFTAKSTEDSTLTVSLGELCASLNGSIKLTSTAKPAKGQSANEVYSVNVVDSSISVVGKSVSFQAAACASRPLVDIRKLLQ